METTTHPSNPLADQPDTEAPDQALVAQAVAGQRKALEALVARHRPWIYNLALRMVLVHQDAEDVTQEVLVKVITKLTTYDPAKGAFRTWLYRIVTNHVINMKQRGYEPAITGFDQYYSFVTSVPDRDPDASPETQRVIADLGISCVLGTLLCLDRTQRVVFILAVAFDVSDTMGSEILGISKASFRKILSRARARLQQSMQGNCGLVNPQAPCRCRNKVKTFIESGAYSVDKLNFLREDGPKVRDLVGETVGRFNREVYPEYARLFRDHPFYTPADATGWLRDLLERHEFKEVFRLD